MKHTIKLGAIVLAIGLSAAEVASAQYGGFGPPLANPTSGGGGFGGGTGSSGFRGLGSSTSGGAFGQRSVGGMPTGGGAGRIPAAIKAWSPVNRPIWIS